MSRFFCVKVGNELFAFEINKVLEMVGNMKVWYVPGTKPYVEGVINLRGSVVPVINLRRFFGWEPAKGGKIVVLLLDEERRIGFRVDDFKGVVELEPEEFPEAPFYCKGVGRADKDLVMILSPEKIVSSNG